MSRLLLLNFGTFRETNRFKQRALADGFLESDAMDDAPPGALVRSGGLRSIAKAATTATSFYGLTPAVWSGKGASSRRYYEDVKTWLTKVLNNPIHCVYLTGHHAADGKGNATMYWDDQSDEIVYMYLAQAGSCTSGASTSRRRRSPTRSPSTPRTSGRSAGS